MQIYTQKHSLTLNKMSEQYLITILFVLSLWQQGPLVAAMNSLHILCPDIVIFSHKITQKPKLAFATLIYLSTTLFNRDYSLFLPHNHYAFSFSFTI